MSIKSHDLAKLLLSMKNVNVMFSDPNSGGGPFSVEKGEFKVAEKGEFPKGFGMRKGFEYILLKN